jgi:hypothetical protein
MYPDLPRQNATRVNREMNLKLARYQRKFKDKPSDDEDSGYVSPSEVKYPKIIRENPIQRVSLKDHGHKIN